MRRTARGTAALELAAVLPIFVMLLAAGIDFAFVGLIEHQLGQATRIASRYGITGQTPAAALDGVVPVAWCAGGGQGSGARMYRVRQLVATAAGILHADSLCLAVVSYNGGYASVGKPEPFLDIDGDKAYDPGEPFTDVNGDGAWSPDQGAAALGAGSEVAVYALRYACPPVTGLTPGMSATLNFESRLVVRNEPFA